MFFLLFLKSYWKPLLAAGLALGLILGSYAKGRKDCALEASRRALEVVTERTEEAARESHRTDRISDSIRADRERKPIDDVRDSCILSSDPFKVQCVK